MNLNAKKIYISEFVILLAILILLFTINKPLYLFRNISAIISLGLSFIILISSFGWKKDNNYISGYATRTLTSLMMSYMIIIYALGIILGFTKGFKAIDFNYFLNLFATVFLILELELNRYLIAKNSLKSKAPLVIFTILSIILCVLLEINIDNLRSAEQKFIFLSTIILPIISEEMLCSYMTYKISSKLSIIYKIVIKMYFFVLPIVPNLGDYIYSSINVLYPYIIYMFMNKIVTKYEKTKINFKKANLTIYSIPLVLVLVILVIFVSGIFKYKLIAIASNSMHPTYDRGDAIIYEKVDSDEIELGDILVFTKEGKIITHRVIKKFYINNNCYFNTKGDNNDSPDGFDISESNVLGKVTISFKYIGYPTVIINEIFGKE